jgi:hypothetical protein
MNIKHLENDGTNLWKSAIYLPFLTRMSALPGPLSEETVLVEGYAIAVLRQRYDGRVQMVEARYDLPDPFAASVLPDRTKIQSTLRSRYIPENFRGNGLFEEFSILLMQDAKPAPDKWIEKNGLAIANFIRSQREVFDKEEVSEILASRTRYSAGELTLVDWEGAVIIARWGILIPISLC